MEPRRGFMIQCPMGTGKSYYIRHNVPDHYKFLVIDGDDLLKNLNIKNKNDFWYDDTKQNERELIINAFNEKLKLGYWIFYSGHPKYINTDMIILPDVVKRWEQLENRDGYCPTKAKFIREQQIYKNASHLCHYFINGDIPHFDILYTIYKLLQ
jgi:hypothetical protein